MNAEQLFGQIRKKKSFLCIGLDTDLAKIPPHIVKSEYPLFEFNRQIIDSTHEQAIAYKPNTAFYECYGSKGWHQLEMTVEYIRNNFPEIFIIADGKRSDIGNTASRYAEAFYRQLNCDALTVSPYMGMDSVQPFLDHAGKWIIVLALTSNKGADDFQNIISQEHERLFETVLKRTKEWGTSDNMMYVVGATRANMLVRVREIVPDHFILVPGIGAQGGNLNEVAEYGLNRHCGLIVNASRSILYADSSVQFASVSRQKAKEMQLEMEKILQDRM